MIGPENIEEKIFQYFEGELSSNESLNLERFIKENPEYQVDFEAWRNSTVQDEKREYKFVDELLVNERFSPKGWLKWASGGVLFIGIILSSLLIVEKFDKGEEKISRLKVNKNHLDVEKQNFKPEYKPLSIKTEKDNKDLIHLNIAKGQNNINISTKSNQLNSSVSKLKNLNRYQNNLSLKASTELFNKSKVNSVKNDLAGDDKLILKEVSYSSAQKKNNLIQLKFSEHSIKGENNHKKIVKCYYFSPESIELENLRLKRRTYPSLRKENYSYENPNTPKLFFTNGKDPYLNYALAHTIEENGSFVGDFNNGEGIRAEMLYRTEWPSVTSENFTSQIISLDTKIDALKGGLGLLVNADRIGHGKLSSTAFSIIYSPKLMVKKVSVEPSFKYTHNQKNIVWNQVQSNDVKDPRNGVLYASIPIVPNDILKTSIVHHDLGLGLLINTDKIYLGGQIDHLNNASYTQDNFDQNIEVPFKISAMIGTEIMKNKESQLDLALL
jgi:hypothetical protein